MIQSSSIVPIERVEQAIYLIRGHKVMLDRDLAGLYGVETRILKSPRAVEVNITIIRTFVKLRRMLESSEELSRKLAEFESKYDEQFRVVFEAINELMLPPEPNKNPIGFHVREEQAVYKVRKISGGSRK